MKTRINKFKIGDKVRWNDPAISDYESGDRQAALDREFTIYDINGDIISISDGYSEAEVTAGELVPLIKVAVLEVDNDGLLVPVMLIVNDAVDDIYSQEIAIDGITYDVELALKDKMKPWNADNIKALLMKFDSDEVIYHCGVKKVFNY